MNIRLALLVVCLVFLGVALSAPASAQIKSLPGLTQQINFKQYAGYITVNAQKGRNLFYWFVESQNNPSTDPLFLWLQGGPGCSSLLGFLTEHGPFIVNDNQEVSLNPYSWNTNASIIYLESPAGVGFSYSTQSVLTNGDNETMVDVYSFLQQWFQLYPEFKGNDFYVSGESYGGHYVPQVSWTILQGNQAGNSSINLKGLLVGNPYTDQNIDSWSIPPFIFFHHLCSLPTYEEVVEYCILNNSLDTSTLVDFRPRRLKGLAENCNDALNQMYEEIGNNINQYDIYFPCDTSAQGLDCEDYSAVLTYLNSADVQTAIHAKTPSQNWTVCGDVNYNEQWPTVLNIYPELMDNIRVTVYAGDVTFNVPALGTQTWVEKFNLPIVSDYQAWFNLGQVAGYYKKFDGITYVTVKGSGHMVPTFTPISGKALFMGYLNGTL